jgi:hypothetical protein
VTWDPNYEYGNIDESNYGRGPPLEIVSLMLNEEKTCANLDIAD